jgi:excisionase family DNA binding protein
MASSKPYLKSSEVAEMFGVNPSTVSIWVRKGRLKPHKTLGGNFRFRREDIEKLGAQEHHRKGTGKKERRRDNRYAFMCPVLVRIGDRAFSFTYNGVIREISGRGLNLVVFDNNGLAAKLEGGVRDLTVLNLPHGLFNQVIVGHITHFERISDREVALGISLR